MCCHVIEQRSAGLHIGNDRRALRPCQQVFRVDHEQLIAPDYAPLAIDCTDAISIPVERHTKIERLVGDKLSQVFEIFLYRRVGVVIGEIPIDLGKQEVMFARKPRRQFFKSGAGSAIACVPPDLETVQHTWFNAVECLDHTFDIRVDYVATFNFARSVGPFAFCAAAAQLLDICAEERPTLEHHFETVVICRVVAAGDLDAAIDIIGGSFRII